MAGRIEDARLLCGGGRYSDDTAPDGTAHAVFLRSAVAHAELRSVDISAAATLPGVLAVLTGEDLPGMGKVLVPPQRHADGTPMQVPDWPPLARGRVRYVGEPVALVVAETRARAQDAAEAILIDQEELPASIETRHLETPAAPLWPHAPDNTVIDYAAGDAVAAEAAFAAAAHVVREELTSQRLVVCPMEPRSATARYDQATGRYELEVGSQGAAGMRNQVAAMMGLEASRLRVVTGDVGGGFGAKAHAYPEYAALLAATARVERPVHWVSARTEAFLSDTQGRDSTLAGELALDAEGRFLAVRVRSVVNTGAYQSASATMTATTNILRCIASVYRTPVVDVRVRCIYTNTVPTAPYRGAGRPEANLIVERLVERAAAQLGLDSVELRRRNMVVPDQMPYEAPNGVTYDSGDFPAVMDRALMLADHAGFAARRKASRAQGRLRGIGVGCYLEVAGGPPFEDVRLDVTPEGMVEIRGGMQSNGQGHATVFPRLVAAEMELPLDQVRLADGDSDAVPEGMGSVGSRSMTVGGAAALGAAQRLVEVLKSHAARLLEVDPGDLTCQGGRIGVAGTDVSLGLREIVAAAGPISVLERAKVGPTFPNGCHVAEVEIDPVTGKVALTGFAAVDDIGRVVDRTLADGQVQGGIAQGLGQVLTENAVYDPESGQPMTGSLMDYGLPRADDLPPYVTEFAEFPARTNRLGTKGAGETGTTGSLCAAYNAVMDALGQAGVTRFDMPATPARIWAALAEAETG
jgi:carbon-monoxide dehydrogenase large subunit